jgi:DNA invertase Pin-like site-specific DNA recombinase
MFGMTTAAAIYARISRDREGRETGVARQEAECRELAGRLGAEVVQVLVDNDTSASAKSRRPRPAYAALLDGARAGRWTLIIAWSSSRLTRRPLELESQIQLAEQHGIRYAYQKSPSFDLNIAQGRMVARMLAAADAAEAETTAERIEAQKRQAAAAGRWRGGPRPYGYQPGAVTLEPVEAANVAWATREVLLGASLRSLAAELNQRGATTSTGRGWTATELRRVLLRARNAGLVESRGEIVGEAIWPAVVDRAKWEAACRVLLDPGRRVNQTNNARRWLGSGLFLCGACLPDKITVRCSMSGSGRAAAAPTYFCRKIKHLVRHAVLTDQTVKKAVLGWISRPEVAQQLVVREGVDVEALDRREREIGNQLDELEEMYTARTWTRARVEKIAAKLNAELDGIQEQRVQAAAGHPAAVLIGAADIEAAFESLDISRRQVIVDALCTVVLLPAPRGRPAGWRPGEHYFDPRAVQIEWRKVV